MPQTQSADRRTRPATGDSTSNDYEPTATGVYPEMGTGSGVALRMGGFSISREEAAMRAVNAQWWAGYWYAMSEVSVLGRSFESAGKVRVPGGIATVDTRF